MAGENSTGGATSSKREAVQAIIEVGGVRSSDDHVPNLWFGELTEERRDTTCSAARKRNEGHGDGPLGYQRHKIRSRVANPRRRSGFCHCARNSESRMRENRLSGLMRGGKQTVIGLAFQSVASRPLYTKGN
jgi:hypothetical protein